MKNYAKVLVFAAIVALIVVPAQAAFTVSPAMCNLIGRMQEVFKVLRILAFVGAGFYMAGWAWTYISDPSKFKMDDVKTKGVGLLVGFGILFAIGVILSFLLSTAGENGDSCVAKGWN
ncbi:MAG: hypothetical protein ACLRFM_01290 [Alphaproteobacteria bacterium]